MTPPASTAQPITPREAFRRCAPALVLSCLLSLVISLGGLVMPVYMISVLSRVLNSGSMTTLAMMTVLAVSVLAVIAVFSAIEDRLHGRLGRWMGSLLGLEALKASVAQTVRAGKGAHARALQDADTLQAFVGGSALPTAFQVFWSPLYFLILFVISPAFGAAAVAAAVIFAGLGVAKEALTRRVATEAQESAAVSLEKIARSLRNSEIVEALGMHRALATDWYQSNLRTQDLQDKQARVSAVFNALFVALSSGVLIGATALGVILILENKMSFGVLIGAKFILVRAFSPYRSLVGNIKTWTLAFAAMRRLESYMAVDLPDRGQTELPRPQGGLEVDRLVYGVPGVGRAILRGVSFTLEPGEALAVMGESASGKSTLARLVLGLWKPTGGAVRLDGHDVYAWERESFGRAVGYLPQNIELFEGTVGRNIARLTDADPADVVAAARLVGVHEMIGRMAHGYDTMIGPDVYAITGGQKQRIALARAFFGDPSLIVLDEPDANLDEVGEAALCRAIAHAKARGAMVMVITHRQAVLDAVDRILVLREGSVDRMGYRHEQNDNTGGADSGAGALIASKARLADAGRSQQRRLPDRARS